MQINKIMNKNTKDLIFAIILIIIGTIGPFVLKFLIMNTFGLIFLLLLNIFKLGGLILLVFSIVKIFSKEKQNNEITEKQKLEKNERLKYISIIYFTVGVLLLPICYFLMKVSCNKDDYICGSLIMGLGLFILIPLGIIFIIIGSIKFKKYLKTTKNA